MTEFPLHGARNGYSPAAYKFRKQLMSSEPVSVRNILPADFIALHIARINGDDADRSIRSGVGGSNTPD
jgi:hypothetical protein